MACVSHSSRRILHARTDFLETTHERHHVTVEHSTYHNLSVRRPEQGFGVGSRLCVYPALQYPRALSHDSLHHILSLEQINRLLEVVCKIKPHLATLQLLQVFSVNQIEIISLMQEPSMILPCHSITSYLSTE